jgi:hypothetical protein
MTNRQVINWYYNNSNAPYAAAARDGIDIDALISAGRDNEFTGTMPAHGFGGGATNTNNAATSSVTTLTPEQQQINNFITAQEQIQNRVGEGATDFEQMKEFGLANYLDTMNRLLKREEKLGTGNPFIDMMEAYAGYRKRKDPNYEFRGLMGLLEDVGSKYNDWRDRRRSEQTQQISGSSPGGQNMSQKIGDGDIVLTDVKDIAQQPNLNAQAGNVNRGDASMPQPPAQDFSGLLSFMSSPQRVAALTSGLGAMTQLRDRPGSMPQHNKSAGTAPRSVYRGVSLNDMWGGIVKDMYDDSGKLRGGTGPLAGTWEDFLDQSKWRGKGNIDTYKGYGTNKTNWSNALIRNNTRDLYNKMVDEYFNWSGGGGR